MKRKKKYQQTYRPLGFVAIGPRKRAVVSKVVRKDPIDVDKLVEALLRVLEDIDRKNKM